MAPEGYVWMNADLSSLEDKTKQNCIINLDPEYVKTLNVKGYDAHLNLGELAGFFTAEEVAFFKWYKNLDKDKGEKESLPGIEQFPSFKDFNAKQAYEFSEKLAVKRQGSKVANYSCVPVEYVTATNLGQKNLGSIEIGQKVTGQDPEGEIKTTRVINKVPVHKEDVYLVIVEEVDLAMETTLNHRWLLENGDYKELQDLLPGDRIDIGECFYREGREAVKGEEDLDYKRLIVTYKGKTFSRNTDVTCLTTEDGNFYVRNLNRKYVLTGNCTYGVGAPKLSKSADIPLKEAKNLINTYWELNWSVKEFAESLPMKEVNGQNFIWSPFTKIWLSLRSDHMKFSVVNQNFGATVFDVWVYFMMVRGIKNIMGYHDEANAYIKDTPEAIEEAKEIVQWAIDKTNEVFNLPVKFEAEPEFAYSYGDVH